MKATNVGSKNCFHTILVVAALALLTANSSFGANGNPLNCWEVKYNVPTAPDGDYLIEPVQGQAFTVYCSDMDKAPKEYLTLVNTGGDFNFGQLSAGGAWPGNDMRTNFTRVRIDPATFIVDLNDTTFSTTTGETAGYTVVPFGWAGDCKAPSSATGRANIDLTGTPFAINNMFVAGGWYGSGSATFNGMTYNLLWNQEVFVQSQVVNFTGGGYCGFVAPGTSDPATGSYPPRMLMKLKWAPSPLNCTGFTDNSSYGMECSMTCAPGDWGYSVNVTVTGRDFDEASIEGGGTVYPLGGVYTIRRQCVNGLAHASLTVLDSTMYQSATIDIGNWVAIPK